MRRAGSIGGCCLALGLIAACAAEPPPPPPALELTDADGNALDPFDADGPAARVFIFARSDCPISNRYAPEVRRLFEEYSGRGVAFWLVYPDPEETAETIGAHLDEYRYGLPALRDVKHRLVALTGAEVTPEAAVFLPDRELVYRGRIDDRYVEFGVARPQARRHDLEEVLEAVLDGSPPEFRTAPAIGCAIGELL